MVECQHSILFVLILAKIIKIEPYQWQKLLEIMALKNKKANTLTSIVEQVTKTIQMGK